MEKDPTILPPLEIVVESLASIETVPVVILKALLDSVPDISGTFLELYLALRHIHNAISQSHVAACCVPAIQTIAEYVVYTKAPLDDIPLEMFILFPLRIRTEAVLRYARILVEEMHLSIYSENSMKVWDEYFEALENLFPESYWRADNSVKKVKDQLWSILEEENTEVIAKEVLERHSLKRLLLDLDSVVNLVKKSMPETSLHKISRCIVKGELTAESLSKLNLKWRTRELESGGSKCTAELASALLKMHEGKEKLVQNIQQISQQIKLQAEMKGIGRKKRRKKGKKVTTLDHKGEVEGEEILESQQIKKMEGEKETSMEKGGGVESMGAKKKKKRKRKPKALKSSAEEVLCNRCFLPFGGSLGPSQICDSCQSVQHLDCVGLESTPEGKWFCLFCVKKKLLEELKEAEKEEEELTKELRRQRKEKRKTMKEIGGKLVELDEKLLDKLRTPPKSREVVRSNKKKPRERLIVKLKLSRSGQGKKENDGQNKDSNKAEKEFLVSGRIGEGGVARLDEIGAKISNVSGEIAKKLFQSEKCEGNKVVGELQKKKLPLKLRLSNFSSGNKIISKKSQQEIVAPETFGNVCVKEIEEEIRTELKDIKAQISSPLELPQKSGEKIGTLLSDVSGLGGELNSELDSVIEGIMKSTAEVAHKIEDELAETMEQSEGTEGRKMLKSPMSRSLGERKSSLKDLAAFDFVSSQLTEGTTKLSEEKTNSEPSILVGAAENKKIVRRGRRKSINWGFAEEKLLHDGVSQNLTWKQILKKGANIFKKQRTVVDLKDKWRNLQRGGHSHVVPCPKCI